jgi:hypothetical protein
MRVILREFADLIGGDYEGVQDRSFSPMALMLLAQGPAARQQDKKQPSPPKGQQGKLPQDAA